MSSNRGSHVIISCMNQVYSIHSDFYYVKQDLSDVSDNYAQENGEILECKLREILKKQKVQVVTGDYVELEDNVITGICKRKNFLRRPAVANLDKVIVVSAVKEPELDLIQLNRYLTFFKYHNVPVTLCFNKEDLNDDEYLDDKIEDIYKPLGYELHFMSALKGIGTEKFKNSIKGKSVALCGQSGVGKSSILNAINPELKLKVSEVSQKHGRGTHTTRHCEILEFEDYKIVDTPGFSQLKFDFLLPNELGDCFDEIKKFKKDCKFKDCLHNETQNENTCAIIKNIENINTSRYESYLEFLEEAQQYKTQVTYGGKKVESSTKQSGGKVLAKISNRKRTQSRNTSNQKIKITEYEDA